MTSVKLGSFFSSKSTDPGKSKQITFYDWMYSTECILSWSSTSTTVSVVPFRLNANGGTPKVVLVISCSREYGFHNSNLPWHYISFPRRPHRFRPFCSAKHEIRSSHYGQQKYATSKPSGTLVPWFCEARVIKVINQDVITRLQTR